MKKYILKPGKHQFAPGDAALHENHTITDTEAEWYLQRYPHIAKLFEKLPVDVLQVRTGKRKRSGATLINPQSSIHENIPAPD